MKKNDKYHNNQGFSPNEKNSSEKDNRVVFHALDVSELDIPVNLLGKYKEYVNVSWEANVYFGFSDLTDKEKMQLGKIEFDIVFFQKNGLKPNLLFIIDKDFYTVDLKKLVYERGDIDFAKRIMNCMYSDLGMLLSDG